MGLIFLYKIQTWNKNFHNIELNLCDCKGASLDAVGVNAGGGGWVRKGCGYPWTSIDFKTHEISRNQDPLYFYQIFHERCKAGVHLLAEGAQPPVG